MTSVSGILTLRRHPGKIVNSIPITLTGGKKKPRSLKYTNNQRLLGNGLLLVERSHVCSMALPAKDSLVPDEVEGDDPKDHSGLTKYPRWSKINAPSLTPPESGLKPVLDSSSRF